METMPLRATKTIGKITGMFERLIAVFSATMSDYGTLQQIQDALPNLRFS